MIPEVGDYALEALEEKGPQVSQREPKLPIDKRFSAIAEKRSTFK